MKKRKTLYITTSFLVVSLIGALILGGYSIGAKKESIQGRVENDLKSMIQAQAREIRNFLDEQESIFYETFDEELFVQLVTLDPHGGRYDAKLDAVMETLGRSQSVANGIANASGIVVAHTANFLIGKDISGTPDFQRDIQRNTTDILSAVIPSPKPQHYILGIRRPIFDKDHNPVGLAGMTLPLSDLIEITGALDKLGKTAETYLVNDDRILITPSKFLKGENKGVLIQIVDTENSETCFAKQKRSNSQDSQQEIVYALDYRGEEIVGTHIIVPKTSWCLIAEIDKSEALDIPLWTYTIKYSFVAFFIILFITLIGFFIGRFTDKKRKSGRKK